MVCKIWSELVEVEGRKCGEGGREVVGKLNLSFKLRSLQTETEVCGASLQIQTEVTTTWNPTTTNPNWSDHSLKSKLTGHKPKLNLSFEIQIELATNPTPSWTRIPSRLQIQIDLTSNSTSTWNPNCPTTNPNSTSTLCKPNRYPKYKLMCLQTQGRDIPTGKIGNWIGPALNLNCPKVGGFGRLACPKVRVEQRWALCEGLSEDLS